MGRQAEAPPRHGRLTVPQLERLAREFDSCEPGATYPARVFIRWLQLAVEVEAPTGEPWPEPEARLSQSVEGA